MKEKPKKKRKTRKAIDYKKIWEFPSLGKCDKSPTGNHRLKMVAYPNPEIWGDGIDQSEYDFRCIYCLGEFHVPYTELQKETEI